MNINSSAVKFVIGLILAAGLSTWARAEAPPIVSASQNFLAALSPEQKAKASFPLDDEKRFDWHFIPKERKGLPLRELDPGQALLAHAVLNAALSSKGYGKAVTIMSLDAVLKEIETRTNGPMASKRDPFGYFFSYFGEPSATAPWGLSIEGHHLSLNFLIAGGAVVSGSPAFLGANPHEVLEGPRKGLRVLGAEEDLGRTLLKSLNDAQLAGAMIGEKAPDDIFTKAERKVEFEAPPKGLARAALNPDQQKLLDDLILEYVNDLPDFSGNPKRARLEALTPEQRGEMRFAWMGGTEKGQPHYYRVQAATFLIEYDNVPNNANHSHTVWRDFNGDFGRDWLAEHYKKDHAPEGAAMNTERKPIPQLSVKEVKQKLDAGEKFQLLDVRGDDELRIASLPAAIQLTEAKVQEIVNGTPKDAPLVFMCHHGVRSLQAAAHFASLGFTNVSSMAGGISAWSHEIDPSVPQY